MQKVQRSMSSRREESLGAAYTERISVRGLIDSQGSSLAKYANVRVGMRIR